MEINILFIKQKGDKMRLINGDALMKAMYHRAFETDGDTMWQSGCWVRYRAIEQVVKEQPTIEEQKKGHWTEEHEHVYMGNVVKEWTNWYCSECDAPNDKPTDFCPHCGRKMEATYDD